jgi:hypothetical protein
LGKSEPDQLGRFIETDQVADPREGGDIGDGVFVAGQPGCCARRLSITPSRRLDSLT